MRAAVVITSGEPLVVEDVQVPTPGPGQALVRVIASGVCHTDLHAARGDWPVAPKEHLIPGHEGYAKIAWGTPGDFRRLRAYLSKYIGAKYLNRTTAQWHHDALGYWPGEKGLPGNPPYGADIAPALHHVEHARRHPRLDEDFRQFQGP